MIDSHQARSLVSCRSAGCATVVRQQFIDHNLGRHQDDRHPGARMAAAAGKIQVVIAVGLRLWAEAIALQQSRAQAEGRAEDGVEIDLVIEWRVDFFAQDMLLKALERGEPAHFFIGLRAELGNPVFIGPVDRRTVLEVRHGGQDIQAELAGGRQVRIVEGRRIDVDRRIGREAAFTVQLPLGPLTEPLPPFEDEDEGAGDETTALPRPGPDS